MGHRAIVGAVVVLLSALWGRAEAAESSFSLRQALGELRRGHPVLQAAAAGVRAADADATAVGLWTNPVVDASYQRGLRRSQLDSAGSTAVGVTQMLELGEEQEGLDGVAMANEARASLSARALGAAAAQLHLGDLARGGFSPQLDGGGRQAAHVPAIHAHQVRMVRVVRARGPRQLEAPSMVAELSANQHARFRERQ